MFIHKRASADDISHPTKSKSCSDTRYGKCGIHTQESYVMPIYRTVMKSESVPRVLSMVPYHDAGVPWIVLCFAVPAPAALGNVATKTAPPPPPQYTPPASPILHPTTETHLALSLALSPPSSVLPRLFSISVVKQLM